MGEYFLEGVVDLFGDPVPRSRAKRGRPAHVPTAENRRFVQLSLICGHDDETIAEGLRICVRTLHRHYFHELAGRRSARLRLQMKLMAGLVDQANNGNVAAAALLDKQMERLRLREAAEVAARRGVAEPSDPSPPQGLGKKAAARAHAATVKGRFAPPEPPTLIN